ncbi:4-galactosyl-N-acetylglucosaminide 3-alpha-L-fucosyltransferase 9-like [Centroberyx affinis]|uniref:4-galactosyl-N-acetylglucosaminide 3-alpha-L-fucosyltransferase 9-like n=1 Tax=Centroberyx affinis TaxID=166261 RepID=UPI003A5C45BF
MSSSAFQWSQLRHFVFSSLILMCSLGLFIMYYKPDINFPTFGIYMFPQKEADGPPCPAVKCAEADQAQVSTPNCSSEQHMNPHYNHTQEVQAAGGDAEPDTIVLIWMWPFGQSYDLNCSAFSITGCHLTDDKAAYSKAHGVLFHHSDIRGQADLPQEPRPWFQKWVWFNMESPANSPQIPELNHLFNLTCNYRLDSNIPVPYGSLVPVTHEDKSFKLPAKDKLVCWIVSHWNPRHKRVEFYNELKKHVKIEAYGNAFDRHLNDQEYAKIMPSCKFYLSFENSIYKDYITEKLYMPMMMGTVPVVLGTDRQNYEDRVPGDSFIHVDDFATPKELAERLHHLNHNHTEYMRYFNWRDKYKVKTSVFGLEHACSTCNYLQKHRGYQAFHGFNNWYWG